MLKKLLATILFMGIACLAIAQNPDSVVKPKADTIVAKPVLPARNSFAPKIKKERVYHPDSTHSPSLAVKRSLLIPGWGQVYNHSYWKVPFIYAGLGLLASAVITNQRDYQKFTALAKIKKTGGIPVKGDALYDSYIKYQADYELYSAQSYDFFANASYGYQRNRDISILSIIGVWGIQTVEAYIQAKFMNSFTVDNDLSMKVAPGFINAPVYAMANANNAYIPGIKITFTLK